MEQLSKMKQHESPVHSMSSTEESGSRVAGVVPFKWESQPGRAKSRLSIRHDQDSGDEAEAHEPRVVQLNLKASLMGVHILDDDEELFFSRQSSMSSMISDKFRTAGTVPFKWEAEPGKPIYQPKHEIDAPQVPLMPPPGSRGHSGVLYPQPLGANFDRTQSGMLLPHGGATTQIGANHPVGGRPPSGVLFQPPGTRASSGMLNAAHFTIRGSNELSDASTSGPGVNLTEKIFRKLAGQAKANDKGGGDSGRSLRDSQSDFEVCEDESDSPVSTLDLPRSNPVSPSSSERSFRRKSTRKSLRRRSEDAVATQVAGPVDPNAPRPKSQLAQYLMSITAMSDDATDDDDIILEGPSEVAWHQPEELQYHPELPVVEGYRSSHGKRPTHERWTANSSSWNLSLVQKPLKTVSTIVNRSKHHHTTVPGLSSRKSKRGKDAILPISLRASYDGGSRAIQGGVKSEKNSGRSRWPDYGSSGRNNYFLGAGRLQIEVAEEPDLEEPDMEQANNVDRLEMDDRDAVDEEDFPFDSPIASSFVFGEADKKRMSTHGTNPAIRNVTPGRTFGKLSIGPAVGEYKATRISDSHDPDVRSMTHSESSHTYSLARDAEGVLDQPPQWVPTRSFSYVKEVVDSMGLSSRALSGFLEIRGSGRFSIDLKSGPKLEYKDQARSPDVRLRIVNTEKPSRRSILSPCLPFLDRHRHKNVPRIQQAPAVAPAPAGLQPVSSFLARLGPVSEFNTPAGNFQFY